MSRGYLIEILSIILRLLSIEFLSKQGWERGICKADKSCESLIGLVTVGPRIGVRGFGAYDCSSGIRQRPARRTRSNGTKDTSGFGERWYPIHRRKRRWSWRTASNVRERKVTEVNGSCRIAGLEFEKRRRPRQGGLSRRLYPVYRPARQHEVADQYSASHLSIRSARSHGTACAAHEKNFQATFAVRH
jgi:hypothetical protein